MENTTESLYSLPQNGNLTSHISEHSTLSWSFSEVLNNTTMADNKTIEINTEIEVLNTVSRYLWLVISPILLIVGIAGNLMNLRVLKQLRFWRKPPYLFLTFLALADITVLCDGLSRYWVLETFNFDLRTVSNLGCKMNLFFIYWSMQLSSWFLVCFVFERFLKTNFTFKYLRIVTIRRCILLVTFISIILTGVDLHYFWTNGLTGGLDDLDCDSLTPAYRNFENFVFVYIDFSVLSVIPFIAMIIMNIFIIKVIRQQIKWRQGSVPNKLTNNRMKKVDINLTKMMLFTSFYFLVATMPISVYFIVDSYVKDADDKLLEAKKNLARTICYLVQFSNYTMNFVLYNLSNAKFRKQFKEAIGCKTHKWRRKQSGSPYFAQSSNSSAKTNSISLTESTLPDNTACSTEDSVNSESEVYI